MTDCNHIFVFGEKREFPSALGSHRAACKLCRLNYYQYVADLVESRTLTGIPDPSRIHVHVFDEDTGTCGSELSEGETCNEKIPQ